MSLSEILTPFRFVSAVHLPTSHPEDLISGGGDPELRIWDWMKGTMKHEISVLPIVQSYVAARPTKRIKLEDSNIPAAGRKARRHANRVKAAEEAANSGSLPEDDAITPGPPTETVDASADEAVFVLNKIESIGETVFFSVVGYVGSALSISSDKPYQRATALFYFQYPTNADSSIEIQALELEKPIIDVTFTLDGHIWVLLDAAYGGSASASVVTLLLKAGKVWLSSSALPVTHSISFSQQRSPKITPCSPLSIRRNVAFPHQSRIYVTLTCTVH